MGEGDEAERFRAALEKIRDHDPNVGLGSLGPGGAPGWINAYSQLKKIATKALKETERSNGQ